MLLKLYLLGTARAEADGVLVTGKAVQPRRIAVLTLLALSPRRTLPRERILWYLWPEHAPDSGRRLLSESIYVLRRRFGDGVIEAAGDDITLGAAVACDVDEFLNAVTNGASADAVAAYRGLLLDGCFVKDAPEFEQWLEGQRERLSAANLRNIRNLAEISEANGNWAQAAELWQAFVRLDPYSSTAAVRAARALATAGERARALQILVAHEERLKAELGTDPDAEIALLARQIRQGAVPRATQQSPKSANLQSEAHGGSAAIDQTAVLPQAPVLSRARHRFAFAGLTLALGVALAAVLPYGRTTSKDQLTEALSRRRMAVMYFVDRSPEHTLGYLAEGLTEYLIDELSRAPGLSVISASAIRRFETASDDSLAHHFGVRTIIRASLEQFGDSVRVRSQLLDAKTGQQIGAVTADAAVGQTRELEEAISQRMAAELRRSIGDGVDLARAKQSVRDAGHDDRVLDLVLRARYLRREAEELRSGARPSGLTGGPRTKVSEADSLLVIAESMDRQWPVPTIERGWIALEAGSLQNGANRVLALAPGLGHAERAITLMESARIADSGLLAQGLYLRGLLRVRSATAVQTFRPESTLIRQGEEDLRRAVQLDSTVAGAWASLALPRWIRGDFAGVSEAAERAMAADAYLEERPAVLNWAWRAAYERGSKREAADWCQRGRRELPNDWHFIECQLIIMRLDVAEISGDRPDPGRAWQLVRELEAVDPRSVAKAAGHTYSPIVRQMIAAMVSAAAGDRARADATLQAARAEVKGDEEFTTDLLYESACLNFVMGRRAEGERLLAAYLRARPDVAGFIERDTVVRRLRRR